MAGVAESRLQILERHRKQNGIEYGMDGVQSEHNLHGQRIDTAVEGASEGAHNSRSPADDGAAGQQS